MTVRTLRYLQSVVTSWRRARLSGEAEKVLGVCGIGEGS